MNHKTSILSASDSQQSVPTEDAIKKPNKWAEISTDIPSEELNIPESKGEVDVSQVLASDPQASLSDQDIATIQEKAAETEKKNLYLQAELQTVLLRKENELLQVRKYAAGRAIEEFLPLMDNFEDSLKQSTTFQQLQEGIERMRTFLHSVLKKLGIKEIAPELGEEFNPHWHAAMATEIGAENQAPNTIIKVLQKGYQLHERVIRPAMVIVSRVDQ